MKKVNFFVLCAVFVSLVSSSAFSQDTFLDKCKRSLGVMGQFLTGREPEAILPGSANYPLDVILQALKLDTGPMDSQTSFLSMGGAFSPLLSYLLRSGFRVRGIDGRYTDRMVADYRNDYGDVISRTSSSSTGFGNDIFDYVISHRMVDRLSIKVNIAIINEALRVAKPATENIRLYGYDSKNIKIISRYLINSYGPQIAFHFESIPQQWIGQDGNLYQKGGYLLVAGKKSSPLKKAYAPIIDEMDPHLRLKM
jgi:hypothetical protein